MKQKKYLKKLNKNKQTLQKYFENIDKNMTIYMEQNKKKEQFISHDIFGSKLMNEGPRPTKEEVNLGKDGSHAWSI